MPRTQIVQLADAVHLGVITEQEAIEFMVADKRGDKETLERLWREHGCTDK